MQTTYDYWNNIVKRTYETSLSNFLTMFDILYEYYSNSMGESGTIEDFRKVIEETIKDEIADEINKDSAIWKLIENRIA